jgi:N-acetylneuraminic acid mutarotase
MLRPDPRSVLLALGSLATIACSEESTPTQPSSGAVPVSVASSAVAATSNTWTSKTGLPDGAFANQASAGVMNDASGQPVVYLLGGRDDDGGCGASISAYRVATDTWGSAGAGLELDMFDANGVGRIGNLLYVSGGESFCGGSRFVDGRFWAFSPATHTLTEKPFPPKGTARGVTGVINSQLYVLPGECDIYNFPAPTYCETESIRRLFRFNPATNRWATKKSAPHFHQLGAGGVINGQFYVAGGLGTNTLDRYDPVTDTWKTLASLPVGGMARGTAMQGKLWVVIDHYYEDRQTSMLAMFVYDPNTNVWTRKATPKYRHSDIVAVSLNGKPLLVAVGGMAIPVEVYTP